MHTILRLPQNALCHADLSELTKLGGPRIRSITTTCASALMRTALRTTPGWKVWIDQLEFAAKECLPFNQGFSGELSPAYWDCPSIAAKFA